MNVARVDSRHCARTHANSCRLQLVVTFSEVPLKGGGGREEEASDKAEEFIQKRTRAGREEGLFLGFF